MPSLFSLKNPSLLISLWISAPQVFGILSAAAATAQNPPAEQAVALLEGNVAKEQHLVQAGETIASIARRYNISTNAILQANPGVIPETLQINQKLVVPVSASPESASVGSGEPYLMAATTYELPNIGAGNGLPFGNHLWGLGIGSAVLGTTALAVWFRRQQRSHRSILPVNTNFATSTSTQDEPLDSSEVQSQAPLHQAQAQIPLDRPYRPASTSGNKAVWQRYLFLGLVLNATLWGLALLYIRFAPRVYTTEAAVTLPGSSPTANVNLPTGQAIAENISPYAIQSQDPREGYKFLALSEPVLANASAKLGIPAKEFGKPRIKLVGNTTFMEFRLKGDTAEQARAKFYALYEAFNERLTDLRAQEATQRNSDVETALGQSQKKLEIAQQRLSEFRSRSGLSSGQQLAELSTNIEQLRRQRAEVKAKQQQAIARLGQLSKDLNLSAQQAAEAFALQTDQLFQENLKNYTEASSQLTVLTSRFLPTYPAVMEEQAKRDSAQSALMSRGRALLGRPVSPEVLAQLNLGSNGGSSRQQLFQELIVTQSEQRGLSAEAAEMDQQLAQLETRYEKFAVQEPELDALRRDLQIAEAIFSSNLAKLDLGRSKNFAAYPLVQIVSEPSLPEKPSSPKTKFVLLGTALGSLLITLGLVSLSWRQNRSSKREQLRPISDTIASGL